MDASKQSVMNAAGLLLLRLVIGGYMFTHGIGKLKMLLAGEFHEGFDLIGLGAGLSLVLVVIAELLCALLVVAGAATRVAAVPVVIAMLVAAFLAHGADPWTMEEAARRFFAGEAQSWASKQPALMFAAVFGALILTGPGQVSVDHWLWPKLRALRARSAENA